MSDCESESEEYGCKHTMEDCDCHDDHDDDEVVDTTECWDCGEPNPVHPYRLPKKHGGWVGYFCTWECVEDYNERGGGDSASRQCYIRRYKKETEHWNATNPGY